jgi:hypothetical protein
MNIYEFASAHPVIFIGLVCLAITMVVGSIQILHDIIGRDD